MDDAFAVRRSQSRGNLFHDVDGFRGFQFVPLSQKLMEVLALDILHRDELDSPGFPKIENTDDVAVGDLACKDQLLLEALQDLGIVGKLRPNDFERDISLQFPVPCLVNRPHAAFAQSLDDFVAVRKNRSRLQGGVAARQLRHLWRCAPGFREAM